MSSLIGEHHESMGFIDLTDESMVIMPSICMVTRFPPSQSASARAALALGRQLDEGHGYQVEVIRLLSSGEEPSEGHPVVMELDAEWPLSADLAARRVGRSDAVVVNVDRHVPLTWVEDLLARVEVPVVLSLDEVGSPGSDDNRRLGRLTQRADATVVPSDTARRLLESETSGRPRMEVIPHGSPWTPLAPRGRSRRNILTWGFVAPGMGAERVLRSMALLGDLRPLPRYRLVGVGDPSWSRSDIADYRQHLTREADRLEMADRFEMVPILHCPAGLQSEIEWSDLIAVPYDSRDRACSRILSEAVSTGRPVVATEFPGAVEMLAAGSGVTVSHVDDHALAEAMRKYLTEDDEYRRSSVVGSRTSPAVSWTSIARKYATLLARELGRKGLLAQTRP